VLFQRWHDLLFAHWPLDPALLRRLLPATLELDLFEGQAWVGVVPFRMSHVRLRCAPPLPGLSAFPELNVRTYVRHAGRAGVWFFSLDAASSLAVRAARAWFHLPYFRARMELVERDGAVEYRSQRTHPGAPAAGFRARYSPVAPVEHSRPGSLEHFLTERYCLFAARADELWTGEIQHQPWPLQRAEATFEEDSMAAASGIALPAVEPRLHFARELDVLIWAPRRLAPHP
jgi:hypothetical protein